MKKTMLVFLSVALSACMLLAACKQDAGSPGTVHDETKDKAAVQNAKSALTLAETEINEDKNLSLPTEYGSGENKVTIAWSSNKPDIIKNDGTVTRPETAGGPTIVTLTATLSKNGISETKEFKISVYHKVAKPEDNTAVQNAKSALTLTETEISEDKNLSLPTEYGTGENKVTIAWSSDKPDIIKNDGTVTRPETVGGPTVVTLTATISKNGITETKEFKISVYHKVAKPEDKAAVQNAKSALTLTETEINEDKNLSLPTEYGTGENKVTIAWSSDKPDIIKNDGTITRPAGVGKITVKLTATIKKGSAADKKDFTVNVYLKEGENWKAWKENAFGGTVTLKEEGDVLTAVASDSPANKWDAYTYQTTTFEKSSMYEITFEIKADKAESLEFSVCNKAEGKNIALAPAKATADWTEQRYLFFVDDNNKGKSFDVRIALKKGNFQVRNVKTLDCWTNYIAWDKKPYKMWGLWASGNMYQNNASFSVYDMTKDSIKTQCSIKSDKEIDGNNYQTFYKTKFQKGKNYIAFKNTGFEGTIRIEKEGTNELLASCTVPPKPDGTSLYFEINVSELFSAGNWQIKFFQNKTKGPEDQFVEIAQMKVSTTEPSGAEKLTAEQTTATNTVTEIDGTNGKWKLENDTGNPGIVTINSGATETSVSVTVNKKTPASTILTLVYGPVSASKGYYTVSFTGSLPSQFYQMSSSNQNDWFGYDAAKNAFTGSIGQDGERYLKFFIKNAGTYTITNLQITKDTLPADLSEGGIAGSMQDWVIGTVQWTKSEPSTGTYEYEFTTTKKDHEWKVVSKKTWGAPHYGMKKDQNTVLVGAAPVELFENSSGGSEDCTVSDLTPGKKYKITVTQRDGTVKLQITEVM